MQIERKYQIKKVTLQLLLVALPTAMVAYSVLKQVTTHYSFLTDESLTQTIYFSSGLLAAFIFYGYRFRFSTTTIAVFVVLYLLYQLTGRIVGGEFGSFYAAFGFLVFIFLFLSGWIIAYGLARSRYFTIFFAVSILVIEMLAISRNTDFNLNNLFNSFAPFLLYSVYIIYITELLRNMNPSQPVGAFIPKKFLGFSALLLLVLLFISNRFEQEFKILEKEWNSGNYKNGNNESMTKRNADGSISNKNQTQLAGSLSKGKQLVFVAKLDNFFEDGQTPNPLYFTSYYYTKYDTVTQSFEADSLMPSNDLFKPDPSKIPLFFSVTDSSKIVHSKSYLDRKVVSADVYKVALSPSEFIAPSTAFYCQPIPVPQDYKKEYASAYKAKMWVSDLNSAYFIYNPGKNEMLQNFQESRFRELRKMTSWYHTDPRFLTYYTRMPSSPDFDSIRLLAKRITDTAQTPLDKIIAIRNYFTSKDQWGQPLFTYSDNPGIPGIPSANKLNYFLFTNRKGYCSYFAGATLFMLRSLGIPSRIAAGFLTIDRSTKNPGWYWFYQDQAHAWVQVYFPGYGWIDFDTTIPDENTRESPQPDQTPPLNMPQAYFVADGIVRSIDTIKKEITIDARRFLIKDKELNSKQSEEVSLDVKLANFSADTGLVSIAVIKPGMHITAASYAESLKEIKVNEGEEIGSVLQSVAQPVPIDEVKIIATKKAVDQNKENSKNANGLSSKNLLLNSLITAAVLLVLILMLPYLIFVYLSIKASKSGSVRQRAYSINIAVLYYLHQMNLNRETPSPELFAKKIDDEFGTSYYRFHQVYQELKYSNRNVDEASERFVNDFYSPFIRKVSGSIPIKQRILRFLDIRNMISFFKRNKSGN